MEKSTYNEGIHRQMVGTTSAVRPDRNLTIGMRAPDFMAETTFGPAKMSDFYGKWVVFFSHPGDFTPVCTTEFISFAKYYPEFTKRNANLIGLSVDSNASHLAWVLNIARMTGIQIPFPIIADRDMRIAKLYGMLPADPTSSQTVRSVYIIDPDQRIRAILQYPMTNGRNIPEIIRLLDALQTTDSENVATPANWMPGQPVIVPIPRTYEELLERLNNPNEYSCMDWYLCYKNLTEPIQAPLLTTDFGAPSFPISPMSTVTPQSNAGPAFDQNMMPQFGFGMNPNVFMNDRR